MKKIFACILAVLIFGSALLSEAGQSTQRQAAGERYWKGAIHRFFLGRDYRKLWRLPIEVEVLDLKKEAGGLTPVMIVGGHQTMGLALKGADGRSYTFRGIDKDPSAALPPMLVGTVADRVAQDQISSAQPGGPLVAEVLMKAAGVRNTPIKFVIMPDDPALGDFRKSFAGLMGTFQEYPTVASKEYPDFKGVTEILDYEEMWERLEANPADRTDSRAYLRVRLLDVFMGDWDRHRMQWRWANIPGESLWQPIPEDRDQAFCRYDGFFLFLARFAYPFLLNFSDRYPAINGPTFSSWGTDHYLLSDLEKSDWAAVAEDLKVRLTDAVIETAVKRLPPEYYQISGLMLESALKKRRDDLSEMAENFYLHMARWVDIYTTDQSEIVKIDWKNNDEVEVQVSVKPPKESPSIPEPYYKRLFHKNETKEIRMYLLAGDDTVIHQGTGQKGIRFRIIGGPGQDSIDDSRGGRLHIYDSPGDHETIQGSGTRISERAYNPPERRVTDPIQDWGHLTVPTMWFAGGPDVGAFIGGGFKVETYRFRRLPYASQQKFRVGYATTPQTFRMDYTGRFYLENSRTYFSLAARVSGIEILRFYGFGNETSNEKTDDYYRVRQEQYFLDSSITLPLAPMLKFSIGPTVKFARTEDDSDRIIADLKPYGSGNFGQMGIWANMVFDTREEDTPEANYFRCALEGRFFPDLFDVESPFGSVHGEISACLSSTAIPLQPSIAIRLGGKHVFGDYPFHEAAFIGGGGITGSGSTVRGYRSQRFAGDSCLFGDVEVRFRLSEFYFLFPGEMGLFGLGDIGRVYFEQETSKKWHSGIGGGLWFSFLERQYTLTLAMANSEERLSFYVRAGFFF